MSVNSVDALTSRNNEKLVYPNPSKEITLEYGENHPTLVDWKFYTAHEFKDGDTKKDGTPLGFEPHHTAHMSRVARVNNEHCSHVKGGVLHIWSKQEEDSIDNAYGKKVKYSTACYRTYKERNKQFWCNFTENMRIEIRFKRTNTVGFNDALWFMGNNKKKWPANGEIDLLENPKKQINQTAHFTLHSENHHAGVIGGKGSVTATVDLEDMTQWNIYWLEWFPDRIVGGVNGDAYFEHKRGSGGNIDWPWSDKNGFYLIFSTGISTNPQAWPGKIEPSQWDEKNPPSMFIDWIRVYTNAEYKGEKPPKAKYY